MNKLKKMIVENQKINGIYPGMVHIKNQSVKFDYKKKNKNKQTNNNNNKEIKMSKEVNFMAISKGREVTATAEVKHYIGLANCKIVAINPTKAELEKIYGSPSEKDVSYIGESEINGVKVPHARIDILFKLTDRYVDPSGKPLDKIFRKSIFIRKSAVTNRDNTKCKVVDLYGNTAWVTKEQLDKHEVPVYNNGPASISKDYRQLYRGEEVLMNILKTYLNIPTTNVNADQKPTRYNGASKSWEVVNNASDGLIRLDEVNKYFTGNFKELRDVISYQPNNTVQILIGVRNVNGRIYQDVYDMVLASRSSNYTRLEKELQNSKENGAYADTEFRVCNFEEYVVTPTNFSNTTSSETNPFESADDIF